MQSLAWYLYFIGSSSTYYLTTTTGLLSLLAIVVNSVLNFVFIQLPCWGYIIFVVQMALFTSIQFGRLKQVNKLLVPEHFQAGRRQAAYFIPAKLYTFTRLHTGILLKILDGNRLFGYCLLTYVCVGAPLPRTS